MRQFKQQINKPKIDSNSRNASMRWRPLLSQKGLSIVCAVMAQAGRWCRCTTHFILVWEFILHLCLSLTKSNFILIIYCIFFNTNQLHFVSLHFQNAPTLRIFRGRCCVGRSEWGFAARQTWLPGLCVTGNIESEHNVFGQSGRYVVIRRHFIYDACRKVSSKRN